MGKNGMLWTDHLSSQPLPHAATWMSFSLQLYPGMAWGIAMAVLSPQELYLATSLNAFLILAYNATSKSPGELSWSHIKVLVSQTFPWYHFLQSYS